MTAEILSLKNELHQQLHEMAVRSRAAQTMLAEATNAQKDIALTQAALAMRERAADILAANEKDMALAREKGLDAAMLDRLSLTPTRVEAMAAGLETIATIPDPVGKITSEWTQPNGLKFQRVSVPLGVIGIIYESRPNVTADAAGLCIKSGNSAILRAGSESLASAEAIMICLHHGLKAAALPEACVQLVDTRDRLAVDALLQLSGLIDVIIPRGGKSLTGKIQAESRIPTLLHLDGNCHTYIHADADAEMAKRILLNAKLRRVGVCGATESLVLDESIAGKMLPALASALIAGGCELRGDAAACAIDGRITPASDDDWGTEYLAPALSVKLVKDEREAIHHINHYGSHHTDAIITENAKAAAAFLQKIDSAIVLHNASTQFADGGEFGFGAEIGIATGKLHARGPVGAEQLTTYKYRVHGSGQVRP